MPLKLILKHLGPWPMNCYILVCEETQTSAIIDPGTDPEDLLSGIKKTLVDKILITHGHQDHVGALDEVKKATNAKVYINPIDAEKFDLAYDAPLNDGETIQLGNHTIRVIHTPGHTPGQVCFDLGDGRIIVGDTIFVNGPGRTASPKDFTTTIQTMKNIVFSWPDTTQFFPGHGPSGTIGEERPRFESFIEKGWPPDLEGDVTWQ